MAFYDPRPRGQSYEAFESGQPPYPTHPNPNYGPAPRQEPDYSHFEQPHAAREPNGSGVAQGSRDGRGAAGEVDGAGAIHPPGPAGIAMPNPEDFVVPAARSSPPQPADTLHEHAARAMEGADDYTHRPNPYYGGTIDESPVAHADVHARQHSPSGSYRAHLDGEPRARRSSKGSGRRPSSHRRSSRDSSHSTSSSSSSRRRRSRRRGSDEDNPRVTEGRAPTWGDSIYSIFGYLRRKI